MRLIFVPNPAVVGIEGWPACDHDEPDSKLARAKVASGLYRAAPLPKAEGKGTNGINP